MISVVRVLGKLQAESAYYKAQDSTDFLKGIVFGLGLSIKELMVEQKRLAQFSKTYYWRWNAPRVKRCLKVILQKLDIGNKTAAIKLIHKVIAEGDKKCR